MGKVGYERDYYGWTQEQAALLRAGQLAELDVQHLIEEIEICFRAYTKSLFR